MKKYFTSKVRKSTVLRYVTCIFLCILSIQENYGQAKSNEDPVISVNRSNVSIKTILADIEKQTGFYFFYSNQSVDVRQTTGVNETKEKLSVVLQHLFEGTGIAYRVIGRQIILYPRDTDVNLLLGNSWQAPAPGITPGIANNATTQSIKRPKVTINIYGIVIDSQTKRPVGGAFVVEKGTNNYTESDIYGAYSLQIDANASSQNILSVNLLGYEPFEETIDGRAIINISLNPEDIVLKETVVTGYTVISKERATGAFNIVKSDAVEKAHASDLSTALLGTTAGMQGKENADGSIDYTIRGITSLYANSSPLIVVDGFPVSNGFKDINPNDVESVTVLKDAAAASIWGARSANGVIVVTTKRAKGQDKLSIEANAMMRIGEKLDLSTVLTTASSEDQVFYEKLAYERGWIKAPGNSFVELHSGLTPSKEYIYQYAKGEISKDEMEKALAGLSRQNNRKQINDLLLQNPIVQQYNLSISGATEKTKNYMSLMYENSAGSMINNSVDRWRINFNNQTSLFKWLDFNVGINVHYVNTEFSGPTIGEIRNLAPYDMILDEEGNYVKRQTKRRKPLATIPAGVLPYEDWSYNILRETHAREYTNKALNTRLQAGLRVKFTDGLTFDTKFQYELNKAENKQLDKDDSYFVRNVVNSYLDYNQTTQTVKTQFVPKGGILRTATADVNNYSWRNQLNFGRDFKDKHEISAIVGFEVSEFKNEEQNNPFIYGYDPETNASAPLPYGPYSVDKGGQKIQIKNITGFNEMVIEDATHLHTTRFNYRRDRFVSVYGNASYTYQRKYSASVSARSDASNLITDKASYRWAPLWSVGGLWNAERETFIAGTRSWLDRLNVRLTYGFNGNVENSTSPYTLLSMSAIPSFQTGFTTASVSSYGNPRLRWEKTSSINGGIDFSLFSDKLFGSLNLYSKQGKDIIGYMSIPSALGTTMQKLNNAKLSNKGIEIELGTNMLIARKVLLFTKLTYAYNKNEITDLYLPTHTGDNMLGGQYVEGYPVNAIWAVNYLGMENDIAYVEGPDGRRTSMDDLSIMSAGDGLDFLQYMGPAIDPHTLGWSGSLSYYGFNLSFLVTGKFGGHFRAPAFQSIMESQSRNIASVFIRDVIEGSDKVPSWQPADRPVNLSWYNYTKNLNTLVESSSFIRMKEITLDYHIPQPLVEKLKLKAVKVYGQVRDLGCLWTANSYGYDPEWLPGSLKPSTTYVLGVTINL